MPTYHFKNNDTGEEFSEQMMISELDEYVAKNPHLTQIPTAPMIVTSVDSGRRKPDQGFRDILRHIKKGNSKGLTKSTINTF